MGGLQIEFHGTSVLTMRELTVGQPVGLIPGVLDVRKSLGLCNTYHGRRLDFSTVSGILSVKEVDEASPNDMIYTKRSEGYTGAQKLYRLSGGVVKCKDGLTDEVVYEDLDTFLIPHDAIDELRDILAGPAPVSFPHRYSN